jgi:hypothetical protein
MIDPHTGSDLPTTPRYDPNRPVGTDREENPATLLIAVVLAVLVLLGIGYLFYDTAPTTSRNAQADSGVTKSEPSPN